MKLKFVRCKIKDRRLVRAESCLSLKSLMARRGIRRNHYYGSFCFTNLTWGLASPCQKTLQLDMIDLNGIPPHQGGRKRAHDFAPKLFVYCYGCRHGLEQEPYAQLCSQGTVLVLSGTIHCCRHILCLKCFGQSHYMQTKSNPCFRAWVQTIVTSLLTGALNFPPMEELLNTQRAHTAEDPAT